MKTAIYKYILFLTLAVIFTTCKSKSESEFGCTKLNTTPILDHAMDFFYFKTGSWWVYEEEKSKEKDSIWVGLDDYKSEHGGSASRDCMCGFGRCYQVAHTSFFSSKYNSQSIYGFEINSDFYKSGVTSVSEGDGVYKNPSGYRITYYGSEYSKESPTYGTFEDMSSIEVKGKTYNDILHLSYPNQTNIPDWLHEAWYARNIYLVKFRLWDETTWNLVDYHINQ